MRLTKYEHACVILEEQGQKLIVDPGMFANLPDDLANTAALIITHEHADHFSADNVEKINAQNPELKIFATREVADKLAGSITPEDNMSYAAGPFHLQFHTGPHAIIYSDFPAI